MKTIEDRFWEKVDKNGPNGCWLWTGCRQKRGYGVIAVPPRCHSDLAHRVSYEIANGPFDKTLKILHKCDNPPCVNPEHLFIGTQTDNMRDCAEKGRIVNPRAEENAAKTHCPKGHEYAVVGFYAAGPKKNWRHCKECFREHARNYRHKNIEKVRDHDLKRRPKTGARGPGGGAPRTVKAT